MVRQVQRLMCLSLKLTAINGEISLPSTVTELDFEDNASAAGNK